MGIAALEVEDTVAALPSRNRDFTSIIGRGTCCAMSRVRVSMVNSRLRLRLSSSNTSVDVKPLADLQQHSNALGRRAFGQQVDLKI
jgi:hypothetical protein